jgi:hypothetical protein
VIDFINNNWVVSLLSILVGCAVTPLLQQVGDYIQSRRGPLTGTYVGFAGSSGLSHFDVEVIKCRQVGKKLSGKIVGLASLDLLRNQEVRIGRHLSPTIHQFAGRVLERQVQIIYWIPERGSQNGGVIVLEPDANGLVFEGFWSGTGAYSLTGKTLIMDSRYIWFRDRDGVINSSGEESNLIGYIRQIVKIPGLLFDLSASEDIET